MEFYPFALIFRHSHLGVSIPNGMEFYWSRRIFGKRLREFQFPTGWNSTEERASLMSINEGFNSQRDGILRFAIRYRASKDRFQFPTGWNSTKTQIFSSSYGYCFNSQRDGILQWQAAIDHYAENSFNSQRDGILHYDGWKAVANAMVSIPNGMEFY